MGILTTLDAHLVMSWPLSQLRLSCWWLFVLTAVGLFLI